MPSSAYHPKLAAFQGIGRFGLLVYPGGEMPASDWTEIRERLNVHLPILRILVLWGDGAFTPGQRAYIESVQATTGLSTAVFTDSTITRGLMTLKRWFGSRAEVFSKSQFDTGLLAFGVTRKDVAKLRKTIGEMQRMIDWSTNSYGKLPLKKSMASRL